MSGATTTLRRTLLHAGLFVDDELAGRGSDADVRDWLVDERVLPEVLVRQLEANALPLRLGGYRITGRVGRGGMGLVLSAVDERAQREVALKLLPAGAPPLHEQRFAQEAKFLASLSHPNVLQVYAEHRAQGAHFLALELVKGGSLDDRLERGPLSELEAWELIRQIAAALHETAEAGIVHRDIKPANILCAEQPDGRVVYKLCDFGIARLRERPEDLSVSRSGVISGSPAYMSPEQVRRRPLDHRSDMYSLGLTVHEALSGQLPLCDPHQSIGVLLARHAKEEVPDLREAVPHASSALARLLAQLTALDPAQRPGSWHVVLGWASSPAAREAERAARPAPPPPAPPPAAEPTPKRAPRGPTRWSAPRGRELQRLGAWALTGASLSAALGASPGLAGPLGLGLVASLARWLEDRLGFVDASGFYGALSGALVFGVAFAAALPFATDPGVAAAVGAVLAVGGGRRYCPLFARCGRFALVLPLAWSCLGLSEVEHPVRAFFAVPLFVILLSPLVLLLDGLIDAYLPDALQTTPTGRPRPLAPAPRPLVDVRRWQAIEWVAAAAPEPASQGDPERPGVGDPLDLLESSEDSGAPIVIPEGRVARVRPRRHDPS